MRKANYIQGIAAALNDYVERRQSELIALTRELIRIPSENTPPDGAEGACQGFIAGYLRAHGWEPDIYELPEVEGLAEHPLFEAGRNYRGRPNIGARRKGRGGRSLLLSGHIDTVPRGTQAWTRDPFGGEVDGNRIYGRGANDMKAGIATNLFIAAAVEELGLQLEGDLIFESVVDEEFGGSNGTLAGRLRGYNADAAVISEPSFLRVCPAQRGGRTAHIRLRARGGVLADGKFPEGVIPQIEYFLAKAREFAAARRAKAPAHEMYAGLEDPVPVSITKISTSPWGYSEPITVPESCNIEFYWQLMPGETRGEVEREFLAWMDAVVDSAPQLFTIRPEIAFPIRWLPGSAISKTEALVTGLASCAEAVLGTAPPITGIEGPCDMFIMHQAAGMAAVLWGARGGNTHGADEYVEIDTLVAAAKALLLFAGEWCGAC